MPVCSIYGLFIPTILLLPLPLLQPPTPSALAWCAQRLRVNNVIEMISELCDPVEPDPVSPIRPASPALPAAAAPVKEPVPQPAAQINKEKEQMLRLKVSERATDLTRDSQLLLSIVAPRAARIR